MIEKTTQISFRVPWQLQRQLKIAAAESGQTMQEIIKRGLHLALAPPSPEQGLDPALMTAYKKCITALFCVFQYGESGRIDHITDHLLWMVDDIEVERAKGNADQNPNDKTRGSARQNKPDRVGQSMATRTRS